MGIECLERMLLFEQNSKGVITVLYSGLSFLGCRRQQAPNLPGQPFDHGGSETPRMGFTTWFSHQTTIFCRSLFPIVRSSDAVDVVVRNLGVEFLSTVAK